MACIELKLEVKTTLKNKDLATLAFKKIHLYSQTAIYETLGLGAYCVPKLICFSSLNTGRVNNQTPFIAMATITHRVTFGSQLNDVTSQLLLSRYKNYIFKRIPNVTMMNINTNSPPTYLTTYSINWCPKT